MRPAGSHHNTHRFRKQWLGIADKLRIDNCLGSPMSLAGNTDKSWALAGAALRAIAVNAVNPIIKRIWFLPVVVVRSAFMSRQPKRCTFTSRAQEGQRFRGFM